MSNLNPIDSDNRGYAEARKRLFDIQGEGSAIQQMMDANNDGLVMVTDKNEAGEDIVYSTANPELIHEFCDRLEAQRDSN